MGELAADELEPPVLVLLDTHDVVHHLELLLEGEGEDWLHLRGCCNVTCSYIGDPGLIPSLEQSWEQIFTSVLKNNVSHYY